MSSNLNLRRRIVTISIAVMLLLGCSMLLGSKTYAADAPAKVKAIGGYESVTVSWKAVEGVTYTVMVNGKVATLAEGGKAENLTESGCKLSFDPFPAKANAKAQKANVVVIASDVNGAAESDEITVDVIHPMYVIVQPKGSTLKLYKTAKSNRPAVTLSGKAAKVVGYGGYREDTSNKRILVKYKGKDYYVKGTETNVTKYVFNSGEKKKNRYTTEQVLAFVNDRGIKPNKKTLHGTKMMWVNTYNQRLYLFKWDNKNKKWISYKDSGRDYTNGLLANTGRELTPYGLFHITSKWDVKTQTGTKWWCIFQGVGVHQQLGQALGSPLSGGCVRIKTSEAMWFYYNIGKGTPILVY